MQKKLIEILRCPVNKTPLRLQIITEVARNNNVSEIKEALLYSDIGFIYPVIDGIPRLLVEAVFIYERFLQKHVQDFDLFKKNLFAKHANLIRECFKKNRATWKSFGFEWQILSYEKNDRIWHKNKEEMAGIFLEETGKTHELPYFKDKIILDVGSGHGIMAQKIADLCDEVIAVELSPAVELAHQNNSKKNVHFIQADLNLLPFENNCFDGLYSSGVIHHTADTKKSLSDIETVLKSGGLICLWLYHPQQNLIHQLMMKVRVVTANIPLPLATIFIMLLIFPFSFMFKQIKRKHPPNYREEMIDLLDALTPSYRHEIPQSTATSWLNAMSYRDVQITTTDQFGFSITGIKA